MADHLSKKQRSWNMSRIKGRNTEPECKLRSSLHRLGFRFRVHETKLPGKPDIVLHKYRTVVFVHGCFWHRHDGCKHAATPKSNQAFWLKKFRSTLERDKRNVEALKNLDWQIIIVWECEINADLEQATRRVACHLQEVEHAT
ncbi:MAG: very short patch repair endonuclease [Bacteroidetes bacterium]|nr:very short patch repair endonuclease [Bacteroidota bacterium]